MMKKMTLEIYTVGGYIERELTYYGETLSEIAKAIEQDENELLYYMRTGDTKNEKSFVFQGFMFRKAGITAAQMKEPEY